QPHITVLPPRKSSIAEAQVLSMVRSRCTEPRFSTEATEVRSFQPVTPTVYLSLSPDGPVVTLNRRLATLSLGTTEYWAFVPHLTLARLTGPAQIPEVMDAARAVWAGYSGPRKIHIGALTLVVEDQPNHWVDVSSWNLPA